MRFNKSLKEDLIVVENPKAEEINSPLFISGKARKYWFFEGSFPIYLFSAIGLILIITGTVKLRNR